MFRSHKFKFIVNFSVSPFIYNKNYKLENDTNVVIANAIKEKEDTKLIMISSRKVYGDEMPLLEKTHPKPTTYYGQNKLKVENEITNILGLNRVNILRCSNIYGLEIDRHTFTGQMNSSLLRKNVISFDFPKGTKKDFLPISQFTEILSRIIESNLSGVLNIGSGVKSDCEKIAEALCKGFGNGHFLFQEKKLMESFFLDISLIKELIDYPVLTKDLILKDFESIGKALRNSR